jgi:hypothetical protein
MDTEEGVVIEGEAAEIDENAFDIEAASDSIGEDLFPSEAAATEEGLEVEVTPEPLAAEEGAAAPETDPNAEPIPVDEAPKTWRPEAAAAWKDLPPNAKAEILKREDDMFRGIEGYKQDAGIGKTLKGIMQPYDAIMKQAGINPFQQVKQLMDSHYVLATGAPAQKLEFMQKLAKDYGVDLGIEAPYIAPEVSNLQQELNAVKSQLNSYQTQNQQAARAKIDQEINTFSTDPKNIYFNEVSEDIARLLKSGVAENLSDAYQKAVRLNPVTYQKEQDRLLKEQQASANAAKRLKTQSINTSTAARVTSKSLPGSATAPLGSIEDTLNEAYAEIKSRG